MEKTSDSSMTQADKALYITFTEGGSSKVAETIKKDYKQGCIGSK